MPAAIFFAYTLIRKYDVRRTHCNDMQHEVPMNILHVGICTDFRISDDHACVSRIFLYFISIRSVYYLRNPNICRPTFTLKVNYIWLIFCWE